jgi:hypothetical protein
MSLLRFIRFFCTKNASAHFTYNKKKRRKISDFSYFAELFYSGFRVFPFSKIQQNHNFFCRFGKKEANWKSKQKKFKN